MKDKSPCIDCPEREPVCQSRCNNEVRLLETDCFMAPITPDGWLAFFVTSSLLDGNIFLYYFQYN